MYQLNLKSSWRQVLIYRMVEVWSSLLRSATPKPPLKQGRLEPVAQDCVQMGFKDLHKWSLINTPGNLCHRLTTLTILKKSPVFSLNLMWLNLCPWSPVLSLSTTEKSLAPLSSFLSIRCLYTLVRSQNHRMGQVEETTVGVICSNLLAQARLP